VKIITNPVFMRVGKIFFSPNIFV